MKAIRKFKKQEKRIIKLLYRTGLLQEYLGNIPMEDLYWEGYTRIKPLRYRKTEAGYKMAVYRPEIYYCTVDYWGEANEHPVVQEIIDYFGWKYGTVVEDERWPDISECRFLHSREAFIEWLSLLPVKVHNSKINKLLKLDYD